MKSKKAILAIIVIVVLVIGGIALNNNSKDSSTSQNEENTNTSSNTSPTNEENSNEGNSNAPTTSENNNAGASENNNAGNSSDSTNTTFSSKDAAEKILKFYIGDQDIESQHLTPISLEGTVAKKQDNSNTFYSDKNEFTDGCDKGLIIVLDNYNEATKTYNYKLKDLFSLKNGTDVDLSTGTVSSDGTVTEES